MKKIRSIVSASIAALTLLAGGVTAAATTQSINAETSGDVQINGIIGSFDNTTPGPNPGDLNEWINVTIPTTALFYTTQESGHQEIVSPTYTITNNSAKGVIATVADVIDPVTIEPINQLAVNDIDLITEGVVDVVETDLFELGSNQTNANVGEFVFSGTATPQQDAKEINPSFKLVLNFAPVVG